MRRHANAATAAAPTNTRRAALPIAAFVAMLAILFLIASFASAVAPTASTGSASAIGKSTATLNGTVNPEGALLEECKFEYGNTAAYGQSKACNLSPAEIGTGSSPVAVKADLTGLSPGTTYHFRLVTKNADGTANGSDQSFKTLSPPVVEAFSTDVVYSEAALNAAINPEGFATTYKFQWGLTAAYGSETNEASVGSDKTVHNFSRFLAGLAEGTTYHYRVMATNANGTTTTADHTFITYAHEPADASCANQAFRVGTSTDLPDCRAYEMVSPVDKNGGDIMGSAGIVEYVTAHNQAAIGGGALTYSSYKAFGDAEGSYFTNQYLARRSSTGWSTHGISPPHQASIFGEEYHPYWDLDTLFKAFSDELSKAWLADDANPPLTANAPQGSVNIYERDNETDTYRWNIGDVGNSNTFMEVEGITPSGSHALVSSSVALTPDAPAGGNRKLYVFANGAPTLVSILPNGSASLGQAHAGGAFFVAGRMERLGAMTNAISDDGSHIYWMESNGSGEGKLYLRLDDDETIRVSESVTTEPAKFLMASTDGSSVLFSVGDPNGNSPLYRFDVATETATLVAAKSHGILGASDDLAYVYFVGGDRILYLYHEGAIDEIAQLTHTDVGNGIIEGEVSGYNVATPQPLFHASRVSADGRSVVFESIAQLTGYDNKDTKTGLRDLEVYHYDRDLDRLSCISCKPSGARPTGKALQTPYTVGDSPVQNNGVGQRGTAAWISTAENQLYSPRLLTADGQQVFFNAFDALVPRDTNNAQDVYRWVAEGVGSCQLESGCVDLISTGQSPDSSEFVDASADGTDVFFMTNSGLDPDDPGLIDIYDARRGGGFARRPSPTECAGDACQSVPPAPLSVTPSSATFSGSGDRVAGGDGCEKESKRVARLMRRAAALRASAQRAGSPARRAGLRAQARHLTEVASRMKTHARRCTGRHASEARR